MFAFRSHLPGLSLVLALTLAAYLASRLPGAGVIGPLVLALLFGVAVGAVPEVRRRGVATGPGARFAAKTLLKVGIVLLGVRLDVRALAELGPQVAAGSLLGVIAAFVAIEAAGRAWRVPVDLRRAVAIGTAVCGASAIAAALPVLRARPAHASVAIGTISLLGTAGVLGFAVWTALANVAGATTAILAGATLQEVGHVVAVGATVGGAEGDLALLVKLSRVVLLAPTLVLLGLAMRFEEGRAKRGAAGRDRPVGMASLSAAERASAAKRDEVARAPRPPLIPGFVLGFLALGFATSAGWIPAEAARAVALAGTWITAAAMAAIGLGVDLRAAGTIGRPALALGVVGFAALLGTMGAYYLTVLP